MRRSIVLASLAATLMSGCFYSPTGVNSAAEAVPVPDSGKVALSYTVPEGVDASKVTFKVEGNDTVTALDDSTNNPHTVSLDVSSITTPGYYTVDVLLNDDTDPTAKLFFVIPDPNAGKASEGDGTDTSGDATTSGDGASSDGSDASDSGDASAGS
jgi:hypothetical protein